MSSVLADTRGTGTLIQEGAGEEVAAPAVAAYETEKEMDAATDSAASVATELGGSILEHLGAAACLPLSLQKTQGVRRVDPSACSFKGPFIFKSSGLPRIC